MRDLLEDIKTWASLYEPAVTKALVAAFLQIFIVAGIGLGNLPEILDAILAFLAVAATVIAGRSIRKSVYSPVSRDADVLKARLNAYADGVRDEQALRDGR